MIDGHSTPSQYQRSSEDFWGRFDGGSGGSIHVKRPPFICYQSVRRGVLQGSTWR